MIKTEIKIRQAVESDCEKIWDLMKNLAVFEKYIDVFAITPKIVKESGFKKSPPDFYCIVADIQDEIAGMLIYYYLPYTMLNKPSIYLKELYVEETYRGKKIGEQLMNALYEEAKLNNCAQIKWTVAPWNETAIKFYEILGANENKDWLNYEWNLY